MDGNDKYKRHQELADELSEIYMWAIVVVIIALLWLWAHDWDVRCLFIECRRLL